MPNKTVLARLDPQRKKRGNLLGNKTFLTPWGTLRFKNAKWYSVDEKYLPFIESVYQDAENPDSKRAFTVVKNKEEALALEKHEKEQEELRQRRAFTKRSFKGAAADPDFHEVDLNDDDDPEDQGGDTTTEDLAADLSDVGSPVADVTIYKEGELKSMSFAELKKVAKEEGIMAKGGWKSADYIKAILEAQ